MEPQTRCVTLVKSFNLAEFLSKRIGPHAPLGSFKPVNILTYYSLPLSQLFSKKRYCLLYGSSDLHPHYRDAEELLRAGKETCGCRSQSPLTRTE